MIELCNFSRSRLACQSAPLLLLIAARTTVRTRTKEHNVHLYPSQLYMIWYPELLVRKGEPPSFWHKWNSDGGVVSGWLQILLYLVSSLPSTFNSMSLLLTIAHSCSIPRVRNMYHSTTTTPYPNLIIHSQLSNSTPPSLDTSHQDSTRNNSNSEHSAKIT